MSFGLEFMSVADSTSHSCEGARYGIVAVCRVVPEVYKNNKNNWGKDRYPLRVSIEFVPNMQRDESNPIPLCSLFRSHSRSEVSVKPYLKTVRVTDVTSEQYEVSQRFFENTARAIVHVGCWWTRFRDLNCSSSAQFFFHHATFFC
jgi:hypothetical protein